MCVLCAYVYVARARTISFFSYLHFSFLLLFIYCFCCYIAYFWRFFTQCVIITFQQNLNLNAQYHNAHTCRQSDKQTGKRKGAAAGESSCSIRAQVFIYYNITLHMCNIHEWFIVMCHWWCLHTEAQRHIRWYTFSFFVMYWEQLISNHFLFILLKFFLFVEKCHAPIWLFIRIKAKWNWIVRS